MEKADMTRPYPVRAVNRSTFLIKILYTQHHSMQGTVQWIEQEKALSFRSYMELTHLLKEALRVRDDREEFRTWEEAKGLQAKRR